MIIKNEMSGKCEGIEGKRRRRRLDWGLGRAGNWYIHLSEAVYWGKQAESAIRAALGYGGCGGDVAGEDARWWVGGAEAACAVAMMPSSSSSPLPALTLLSGLWICFSFCLRSADV